MARILKRPKLKRKKVFFTISLERQKKLIYLSLSFELSVSLSTTPAKVVLLMLFTLHKNQTNSNWLFKQLTTNHKPQRQKLWKSRVQMLHQSTLIQFKPSWEVDRDQTSVNSNWTGVNSNWLNPLAVWMQPMPLIMALSVQVPLFWQMAPATVFYITNFRLQEKDCFCFIFPNFLSRLCIYYVTIVNRGEKS